MQQVLHLYEYIYDSLVSQIECGAYLKSGALPSQQQICAKYNVGITTVRRVLKMLDKNGYIHTACGKPAAVTYQASPEEYCTALAGRKHAVEDAYHGLGTLMPALYSEGAKRCSEPEFHRMQEAVDQIHDHMNLQAVYDQTNIFFASILSTFHNPLILDLEHDAENFLYIPHLPFFNIKDPFEMTPLYIKSWLQNLLDLAMDRKNDQFFHIINNSYKNSMCRVHDYFVSLERFAKHSTRPENDILWFRVKDHSELYIHLAMSILRRIFGGEFDHQKYLPSIPRFMSEYGVTKDTVSRAVTLLNTIGIIETYDKKGTVISTGKVRNYNSCIDFSAPFVQQQIALCLESLQIMALTIRACAASFSPISKEWICNMESKLSMVNNDRISPLSVQLLMGSVIQLAPCHSLKNIYLQLNELMLWGYYFKLIDNDLYTGSGRIMEAMLEVVDAFKANDSGSLPAALEKAFLYIYNDILVYIDQLPYPSGPMPIPL